MKAGAEAIIQKVIATGEPVEEYGYPMSIPGKPDAAWDAQVARLPFTEGEGPSALLITWDATEHKRVEKELKESEERFRLAQMAGHIGVFDWHMVTDVTIWSDELKKMYGLPVEYEPTTERWAKMVHPEDVKEAQRRMELVTGKKQDYIEGEFRIIRKDGQIRWLQNNGRIYYDMSGKPYRMIGTTIDITERKESQIELKESEHKLKILNESLEEMVIQRTRQVHALSTALTMAEQRERKRFSIVLHENLQQKILGALLLFKQHLKEHQEGQHPTQGEDEIMQGIAILQTAAQTAKTLSVELNPPILGTEGFDAALNWLIKHMYRNYGLEIELSLDGPVQKIQNETQLMLTQMVRELLYNVHKHAKISRASVSVICRNKQIQITVSDKGKGFQSEQVLKETVNDSRLGLLSIRERLRLFGGDLTIQSTPEQGTSVSLIIPNDRC